MLKELQVLPLKIGVSSSSSSSSSSFIQGQSLKGALLVPPVAASRMNSSVVLSVPRVQMLGYIDITEANRARLDRVYLLLSWQPRK
jgi:hypothetical protein